jgi:hypothetical protein
VVAAPEVVGGSVEAIDELAAGVVSDGGAVVGLSRATGGMWQLVAALPIEKVSATPYQRDLSPATSPVCPRPSTSWAFMDPIVAVRTPMGSTDAEWPSSACRDALGARSIMALVVRKRGCSPHPRSQYREGPQRRSAPSR